MKTEELNRLLEKYYKGESTEEDEIALRLIFNENSIPEGYEAEKAVFSSFMSATEVPEPSSGFESRIMTGIDKPENKHSNLKIRKFIRPFLGAAAGLLIIAGSYLFFIHKSEPRETFSDPGLAYAETMKILMDVSSQLNIGARALEPVSKINELTTKSFEVINKSTKTIEKNLKNLNYLQNATEITHLPLKQSINK